ncbi:hypothetical protein PR048_022117 [Dryococelus australis]|uniref:Uncharacterized protein n=1 Tax=Dryococelus australis TaxID=614101 RepID=A0ABQ9H065_9NEOP|nr:hypothetical protein PR048_022117 [Dryococelus australis]
MSAKKAVEKIDHMIHIESVWSRALKSNSEWPDKEEFLDVIYWSRQALGIIIGLIWGLIPLKGFVALLLTLTIDVAFMFLKGLWWWNAGVIYLYFSSYQSVDEEEYGGAWELTKEGFMTSFAGFLVTPPAIITGIAWLNTVLQQKSNIFSIFVQVTWIIIYSGLHFD